jgi:putative aldouronate transport system substrate-binding protein
MVLPPLAFTEEQAVAIADPEATIVQHVKEMFTRFVRGEGDIDAEWDQYLATLDGMGLTPYLQVYQEAYDAKYGS